MARVLVFLCLWFGIVHAVTVFDGLRAAGASLFAEWIQSNPTLAALYTSSGVQTIYAPTDDAFSAFDNSSSAQLRRFRVRQITGPVTPQGSIQCSHDLDNVYSLSLYPGAVIQTNADAAGNRKQSVVSHPTTQGNGSSSKRDLSSPIRLFSGLGNNVSIIKADNPYDGGLIHTVDGFFTLPQSFSATFNQTNTTSFSSGLAKTNLSSVIDNPAGVTVFSTTNEAFQAGVSGNITNSPSALSGILSNHVIPNFVGYTPVLRDGTVLKTQAGTNLTVTIKDGDYYINNARIVASDQITTNGVAHVLDSIITATTPSLPLYTGAAASNGFGVSTAAVSALSLLWALFI